MIVVPTTVPLQPNIEVHGEIAQETMLTAPHVLHQRLPTYLCM